MNQFFPTQIPSYMEGEEHSQLRQDISKRDELRRLTNMTKGVTWMKIFLRKQDTQVECPCGVWYDLREFALDCYFQDHPWVKEAAAGLDANLDQK